MRIGHYMRKMFEPGGIASYIRRISAGLQGRGHEILYFDLATDAVPSPEPVERLTDESDLVGRARELHVDILHLHCDVRAIPSNIPTVRTVHTHSPYCPSQGRFLKRSGSPCDRNYTLLGCLWGHAADRCGSVRPAALGRNFSTVRAEMRTLPTIPVLAVSDFLKRQMVRAGYPAAGIEVLHPPAPTPRDYTEPPRDGPPRFVFLGRTIPHKGVDWLLRAAARARPDVRFDLAGTGNQEGDYRTLATSLGLEHRVQFHGWLDGPAIESLLRDARALIFPSLWHEPAGLVAFEAMVAGRAVIASRVGGIPEIVTPGVTGLLVEPGDTTALANEIDRLAADRDLAKRLGEAGRLAAARRHSLDAHLDRLSALYARLVPTDVHGVEGAGRTVR